MEKIKVGILKTDEVVGEGRLYTKRAVDFAMQNLKHDTTIAVIAKNRNGDETNEAFLKKSDFEFDRNSGILYVSIPKENAQHLYGLNLSPMLESDWVKRGFNEQTRKNYVIIEAFYLHSIQATAEESSFKTINTKVTF
jgi:hypothetical protein